MLPVGRKANWSTILWAGIAGKIHLETTIFFYYSGEKRCNRDWSNSESVLGLATLETGVTWYYRLSPLQRYNAAGKGQIQNMCNHMGNLIRAVVIKPPMYVIEAW